MYGKLVHSHKKLVKNDQGPPECAEIQWFSWKYWIPALTFSLSQTPPKRGSRQDPGNRYRSHIKGKTCSEGAHSGFKYNVNITFVCVCNLLVIKIHGIIFPLCYNELPKNPKKYFYSQGWYSYGYWDTGIIHRGDKLLVTEILFCMAILCLS